jgi:hypothetical protein
MLFVCSSVLPALKDAQRHLLKVVPASGATSQPMLLPLSVAQQELAQQQQQQRQQFKGG